MKLTQAFLACFCMFGAAQLAWSQTPETVARPIPGYLNPVTGKFTTRILPATTPQATSAAAATGTNIFFREDFQIFIANYDQKGTSAVCTVTMSSSGDSIGQYYDEQASAPATPVGSSGFSCDVPVLTSWLLQTPTTDKISATVSVTLYTPTTQTTSVYLYPANYRTSTRSLNDLAQPGNGQTVVNNLTFSL